MPFETRSDMDRLVAIADVGSIDGASIVLGMTQPALSRAVRRLEERAGVQLFERHSAGVRLTPAGALATARAREILRDIARLGQELAALNGD